MIVVSSLTFDPAGFIEIDPLPESDTKSLARRVNRVETLDGGVAVNDFGYTDADRTLKVSWAIRSADEWAVMRRLFTTYGRLNVAAEDGFFIVAPESIKLSGNGVAQISLLVLEKLSGD